MALGEVEEESQSLFDFRQRRVGHHAETPPQTLVGNSAQLIADDIADLRQTPFRGLNAKKRPERLGLGRDRNDRHKPATALIEDIC